MAGDAEASEWRGALLHGPCEGRARVHLKSDSLRAYSKVAQIHLSGENSRQDNLVHFLASIHLVLDSEKETTGVWQF